MYDDQSPFYKMNECRMTIKCSLLKIKLLHKVNIRKRNKIFNGVINETKTTFAYQY